MFVYSRTLSRLHSLLVPEKRLLILHSSKRNLRTVFHPQAHKQRLTDNYFKFTALMSRNIVINVQLLHPRFCRPSIFQRSAPLLLFAYGGCVWCVKFVTASLRGRMWSVKSARRSKKDRLVLAICNCGGRGEKILEVRMKRFVGIRKRRYYSNALFNVYN